MDSIRELFGELESATSGDLDWDSLEEYLQEASEDELDYIESGLTWVIGALIN